MTAPQYEDTVQPETAPCADCGVLVDELWDYGSEGEVLCEDCAECILGDDEPEVRCINAHDLCWQGGPCPYCEPRS